MGKMYHVDLTAVPTHEEKWQIYESFQAAGGYWEIYDNWNVTNDCFESFDIHWESSIDPKFPPVPSYVTISIL